MSFFEKTLGAHRTEKIVRLLEVQTETLGVIDLQLLSNKLHGYKGGDVLDIGTGEGSFLIEIAKMTPGINYLGLELNTELLNIARSRLSKAERLNVEFEQAVFDSQYNHKHDLILARFTLQHTNNPQDFVQDVYRSLNADGCFVCIEPVYDYYDSEPPEKIWVEFLERTLATYSRWGSHPNIPKQICRLLSYAGFRSIRVSTNFYSPITIGHERFRSVVLTSAEMLNSEYPDIWDRLFLEKLNIWLQKLSSDPFMVIAHICAFK